MVECLNDSCTLYIVLFVVLYKKQRKSFFNRMTNIKNFDPSLLSIENISFEKNTDCGIYEIE